MANRFVKKKRDFSILKSLALPVLVFAVIIVFFQVGVGRLNDNTRLGRLRAAREAVSRAAVQCYALEGQYPPHVEYLEEHYGLMVNRQTYLVDYRFIGGNLMPLIEVRLLEDPGFGVEQEDPWAEMEDVVDWRGLD